MTDTQAVSRPARPKRLDPFEAVFQVAQLTVKRSLNGWRAVVIAAIVLLPAGLAFLVRDPSPATFRDQEGFFYGMLGVYHFGIAVPFVALLFATGFPWPEAEEGTLTYWFTSPVPRWTVLLGRYAASLLVGSIVLCIDVLSIGLPIVTSPEAQTGSVIRAALACTLLAYPAYLALFQLVSTAFRQGLVFGVVFILVENFMSMIPGMIVRLTLVFYVRSQLWPSVPKESWRVAEDLFHVVEPASSVMAVSTLVSVAIVALGLSLFVVEFVEYRGRTSQPG